MTPRRILSISGGKDSTAMYLQALEVRDRFGMEFEAVFADTGNEHEATLDYVRDLPRRTGGAEIHWVKADFCNEILKRRAYVETHPGYEGIYPRVLGALSPTGNPFLDLCLWKGRFPSSTRRFCTVYLKMLPIHEYITTMLDAGVEVHSWQGVRAEESANRAKLPKRNLEDEGLTAVRPLLRWKLGKVLAMHKRHGLPMNPLYKQGMFRVGCMPCINSRKEEIFRISQRFPEHIDRIREWEALISAASKKGGSTFFHKDGMSEEVKADRKAIARESGIDGMIRWSKTIRGGRQFALLKLLPPLACQSEYGLCE